MKYIYKFSKMKEFIIKFIFLVFLKPFKVLVK
jgi:hypothetical protein